MGVLWGLGAGDDWDEEAGEVGRASEEERGHNATREASAHPHD